MNKSIKENKILVYSLTTSYAESSKASSHVHILNKEFINLGMKVKTITPHQKGSFCNETLNGVDILRFKYLPEKFEIGSAPIAEVSKSKKGILKIVLMSIAFFFVTFAECVKKKPDILHGHWAFPGGFTAVILSKIFRSQSVITIHGGEITLLRKFILLKKIVINILNRSPVIFANSTYTKDRLIRLGIKEEKIIINKVSPNFVEPILDDNFLNNIKSKIIPRPEKIILFIGRLVEAKGVEYLIRALLFTQSKNIHLIVAGDGMLLDELKKLTQTLDLKNNVTFFGWANKENIGKLYAISDLFVCPSIDTLEENAEGLGLVIPEAMNAKLPVIATAVGGIVDTVKNEKNGLLVNQKDPKSIALAIDKIMSDKVLETRLIENSKYTVTEFSPSMIAKKYFDVFYSLIKNKMSIPVKSDT